MGTIVTRTRSDGKPSYLCQIARKSDGKTVRENRTFRDHKAAKAWLRQREAELDNPKAFKAATQEVKTLGDAIGRYLEEYGGEIGKTKAACLAAIQRHSIAGMSCADIGSDDIVSFARTIHTVTGLANPGPSTINNYLSHMASVFAIAKKAWGYPLDPEAMSDAMFVLRKQRAIAKSDKRERRPTLDELDRLLTFFQERAERAPHSAPMVEIVLFAAFSTRRMEEITRIRWTDFEATTADHAGRVMVRDMKNPGAKRGNDVWCELPPEAEAIVLRMKPTTGGGEYIFPYTTDAIGAAFTRACKMLDIEGLHFHDLRHEGVSRLFEAGWNIPHVALVSGHRSWASLQRYAQLRQRDDKFAGWKWRPKL
ncbi:tyrosine-type recombinase/integrase [Mesorhizobium sp. dw_380]|uniref:tyrosine-type recombinase/integrase n=1 Tax=Mesorhizobium sp. dw_380 TaxID=2812001 RepID=UPI001BDE8054|nr:tyrosine-type recombinase/integrase [Mesorhizobium sp. dw_380]